MTELVVVTWNVLADNCVRPERHPDVDPDHLDADSRRQAIVDRLTDLTGIDIVCLQEVDPILTAALHDIHGDALRWCPRGYGRMDAAVTIVPGTRWEPVLARRLSYNDAQAGRHPTGHVAQLLTLHHDDIDVVVANTHLRWAPADTDPHPGIAQATELIEVLHEDPVVVIAGDVNDRPDGPVRARLAAAGYDDGLDDPVLTAWSDGHPVAIDMVTARGAKVISHTTEPVDHPLPDDTMPSDHVPITATIAV